MIQSRAQSTWQNDTAHAYNIQMMPCPTAQQRILSMKMNICCAHAPINKVYIKGAADFDTCLNNETPNP